MLIIGLTGSIATGKSTVSALLGAAPYEIPVVDADVLAREAVAPGTPGYHAIIARFAATTPDLLLGPADDSSSNQSSETSASNKGSQPLCSTAQSERAPDHALSQKARSTSTSQGLQPLDRAALGRRVFGSDAARVADRKALNAIVHPAVRRLMVRAVLKAYLHGQWAVVLDVPLLFEAGLDVWCGAVLVVGMRDGEIQLQRLRERDRALGGHMTEQEARDRVASQGSVREKAERALARGPSRGFVLWNDGSKADLQHQLNHTITSLKTKHPTWWTTLLWLLPPVAACLALCAVARNYYARRSWERQQRRNS